MLQTSVQIVSSQPRPQRWGSITFFWASRPSLPAAWLILCSSQKRGTSSQILARRHTQINTPVIWICDLCHQQIKKQQTSIRCNHTHNTHWVHLNCIQIKQRQYNPDWRCTIHTPTQIVTITPNTDNTITHRRQITTQPLTDNNQPKGQKHRHISKQDKRHQKQSQGTKNNSYTAPNRTSSQYKKQSSHRKLKHQKYPTTPHTHRQRALTMRRTHHTDQGQHNFHKHKHTQGHQHTELQLIKILNSYAYTHWILDFKYILLLLLHRQN